MQLEDAPWPSTKEELIDYAIRSCLHPQVVENLRELEDDGEVYDSFEDICDDIPSFGEGYPLDDVSSDT